MNAHQDWKADLAATVGADGLILDPARIAAFATDVYRAQVSPAAVVRPRSAE